MSIQENKLKDIADAIREKDGTTEPIIANDFPARIRAIKAGGGSIPEGIRAITLIADPPQGGEVFGGGLASDGMTININAEADKENNFNFVGWKEDGVIVSDTTKYTFPVNKARILIAEFFESQYVAGVDWWETTLPSFSSLRSVTYGDGKFVAVEYDSVKVGYSEDGIIWNTATLPSSAYWDSVTYGDGKFVAVAGSGNKVAYSEDGIIWNAATLPSSASWSSVTHGDGKFVVVVLNSNKAAYSTARGA